MSCRHGVFREEDCEHCCEVDALESRLDDAELRCAKLHEQLDSAVKNPDDPAYWLHSASQLLAAPVESAREELATLRAQLTASEERITNLKKSCNQNASQAEHLLDELDAAESKLAASEASRKELREALEKIKWHRKPGGTPTKYEYEVECIAAEALANDAEQKGGAA